MFKIKEDEDQLSCMLRKCRENSQELEEFFKYHSHTEFQHGQTYSFGKYVRRSHGGKRIRYEQDLGRDGSLNRRGAAEKVREPAVQLGPG